MRPRAQERIDVVGRALVARPLATTLGLALWLLLLARGLALGSDATEAAAWVTLVALGAMAYGLVVAAIFPRITMREPDRIYVVSVAFAMSIGLAGMLAAFYGAPAWLTPLGIAAALASHGHSMWRARRFVTDSPRS